MKKFVRYVTNEKFQKQMNAIVWRNDSIAVAFQHMTSLDIESRKLASGFIFATLLHMQLPWKNNI